MTDYDDLAEAMLRLAKDGRVILEPEESWFVALGDGGQEALDCIAPILAMALRSTATSAVLAERERCAKVCEEEAEEEHRAAAKWRHHHLFDRSRSCARASAALGIAADRIRAGEEPSEERRDYLYRIVALARSEPDLPMESVVFQASLPDRKIGP